MLVSVRQGRVVKTGAGVDRYVVKHLNLDLDSNYPSLII